MEVIIAGYNKTALDNLNPEIISASYARTSRDPRPIPEIREDAKLDIEKARKSNKSIVFEMGHASIAEHVVFNIDIIGVSRFLVEEIESHRLASYTEKSQRYVLFDGDYTIPDELNVRDKPIFISLVEQQNEFYKYSYPILLEYFKKENPEKYEKDPKTVEGWAKEDARYIIPMATQTQLGMTISARNLELMIRRLRACPYWEHIELAYKLYDKVSAITPSLFPYITPTEIEYKNKERLFNSKFRYFTMNIMTKDVNLINNEELKYNRLHEFLEGGNTEKEIILNSLKNMKVYDSAPREFEVVDFEFLLRMSSSCFAQLKRHRMMTILPKPYSIYEGGVIPESFIKTGLKEEFTMIINKATKFSYRNEKIFPYIATNAHRRIVYVKINLREMYHFCRMRMDGHAQWEIRGIANEMHRQASEVCPIGMILACGKDKFEEVYNSVFK